MAVRGGLTRFARPCGAARSQARGLSNWLRQLSNPGRGSHPPVENIKKRARTFVQALISNMAVRGGLTRFARPCSPLTACAVCPTGCASCRTPVGVLIPCGEYKEKSPYFRTGSHLEYGGEGGIRTPDTLPYTHFPGVLLQPLGHLTILSFPLLSGTGANVGKYVSPVNQLFAKKARLDKLRATCSLNVRNPFFCRQ